MERGHDSEDKPPKLSVEDKNHYLMQAAYWGIAGEHAETDNDREYADRQRRYYLIQLGMIKE